MNKSNISVSDFTKICRTCLSRENLQNLYENCDSSDCLVEKLISCTYIQFSKTDSLPDHICEQCIEELNKSYLFAKQCETSDLLLRQIQQGNEGLHEAQAAVEDSGNMCLNDNSKQEELVCAENRSTVVDDESSQDREEDFLLNDELLGPVHQEHSENEAYKSSKRQSQRTKVVCEICSKLFPRYELKIHMRTHTKERPFMCQECGRQFTVHCNLQRHILTHTGTKPHKCNECGKSFVQLGTLNDHLRTHTDEKPFECRVCGRTFRQNVQLRVHKRVHSAEAGAKPTYNCPECQKSFTFKSVLKTHLLKHGSKNFSCTICGKLFSYRSGLKSHEKTHNNVKSYTCSVCGKQFTHLAGLKTHNLVHTKEKKFVCDICQKAFAQSSHLKTHLQSHAGVKAYPCALCVRTFASNSSLKIHTRIHSGVRPFSCDLCGKEFYDNSTMRKHRRRHDTQR